MLDNFKFTLLVFVLVSCNGRLSREPIYHLHGDSVSTPGGDSVSWQHAEVLPTLPNSGVDHSDQDNDQTDYELSGDVDTADHSCDNCICNCECNCNDDQDVDDNSDDSDENDCSDSEHHNNGHHHHKHDK